MVVTAVAVVDQANDNALLVPMVEQAEETTGTRAPMTLACSRAMLRSVSVEVSRWWCRRQDSGSSQNRITRPIHL